MVAVALIVGSPTIWNPLTFTTPPIITPYYGGAYLQLLSKKLEVTALALPLNLSDKCPK